MKNVIVRFREYEPHASSAERGIVQLVLKAPEKILEYNSHQLAEAAFSSPATVVRLCKKIGFSGYKAMQQALIRDLSAKQKKEEQTKEILECANEAKRKGAPLIAITRFADSSLVRLADYNLYVAASEVLVRSGAMSSRISQLNVVDILYTAYINRHFDEHVLQAQKTYMRKENERKEGDV